LTNSCQQSIGVVAVAGIQPGQALCPVFLLPDRAKGPQGSYNQSELLFRREIMTLESLRLARNILLRSAAICYAFLILTALIWLPFKDTWTGLTCSWYNIPPEKVQKIVIDFFSVAKFYAIFVLLVPGLALHWTIKRDFPQKQA
jgi:hypothetical protein